MRTVEAYPDDTDKLWHHAEDAMLSNAFGIAGLRYSPDEDSRDVPEKAEFTALDVKRNPAKSRAY